MLDSYREPIEAFDVNVVGTAVVLDALRTIDHPCAVVVVTSDKCYANDESGQRFTESDPLGGHDPYSASKAGTELVAAAYRSSFFRPEDLDQHGIAIATARAGNVIGGGDWTGHGIVADIVRSIGKGEPVSLRHPNAIRPWQHVLEPLAGYLTLAARLEGRTEPISATHGISARMPEDEATVGALTDRVLREWGIGSWLDNSHPDDVPEAGILRLSIDRTAAEARVAPALAPR